jgi:hypothetical protein
MKATGNHRGMGEAFFIDAHPVDRQGVITISKVFGL